MSPITRRDALIGAGATAATFLLNSSPLLAEERIELRVTAAPSTVADMYRSIAEAFGAQHPNILVNLDTTQRDYDALVDDTLRDVMTGQLADVSIQGNNKIRLFVDRGLAVPLNDYLAEEAKSPSSTLSPSVASIGQFGDKVYGLGLSVSTPIVFYNLDLVKKAGVDAAALPVTWEGILDLAARIHDPKTNTLGGYLNYTGGGWMWTALIESQGARMMTADEGKVGFDGPEGLKALQILKSFGEIGQSAVDMPRDQVRQLFSSGNLGILVDSSSNLGNFERQAGGRFDIVTRAFPLLSPDARLPAGGALGVVFAKDPARQKAAWEFVKFAASAEGQTIIADKSSYMVANSLVATDAALLGGYYAEKPNMAPVVDQLSILAGWYAFPGQNGNKITKVMEDHLQSVVTLRVEPAEALAAMSQDVTALLPR
ncbi:multiple sugar transport system substrate-binding protein [Mesorhizobium albiziae]|uniref:Multiple sugar transport system substrate-binding protein n=1 Tax=Neomesorhizobium albiziae TaxID=335020 RepID=A0A1I4FQ42_9HYPH|nr:ABC transporter substrate-binding protein [Mesorhizobium albiziae]GLS33080.1 ABC transporter substrate-binding protein [Mesorhizobium albiziae]SFL19992.1 multiple sugar transport system substrate-binding protein [Mesorhizobium albiziae]